MSKLESLYEESKNYSNTILQSIRNKFDDDKIRPGDNEELIISDSSRKEVMEVIKSIGLPSDVCDTLLDIVEVRGLVYVRLNTK